MPRHTVQPRMFQASTNEAKAACLLARSGWIEHCKALPVVPTGHGNARALAFAKKQMLAEVLAYHEQMHIKAANFCHELSGGQILLCSLVPAGL